MSGHHFGACEDAWPFAKGEIGDDRGALVKPADEMEQQLTAGLREGQIAEFIGAHASSWNADLELKMTSRRPADQPCGARSVAPQPSVRTGRYCCAGAVARAANTGQTRAATN